MSGCSLAEIRRHPVKSMAGERLEQAEVDARGVVGDRWWAVVDTDGRLSSGKDSRRFRRRDAVFDYAARTVDDHVEVSGRGVSWRVGQAELDAELSAAMGAEVAVRAEGGVPHQDAGQVSLVGTASLDWCREHLGVDGNARRIRPNLVVATEEPFVEESWEGAVLHIGADVALRVVERIERCRMVDIAQGGLPEQRGWLKSLGRERYLCLGVYAEVVAPGTLVRGDRLHVVR